MKIPHLARPHRSRFYPLLDAALRQAEDGWPIRVALIVRGGYAGDIEVRIGPPDEGEFEVEWEAPDWTRFPARIRAACTALRDAGRPGTYRITHHDGELTIRPAL